MKRVLLLIFTLVFVLPAWGDYSTSGIVSGSTPFIHTVKCNPEDSFRVEVLSNHPTSVTILSMTPDSRADGGWAFNAVSQSNKNNSHLLEYQTPSGDPVNNASHWHYRVSILASTNEQTNFSLSIIQFGSGAEKSAEFNKRAKKQLDELARDLSHERKKLFQKIEEMDEWLVPINNELHALKDELLKEKDEIAQLDAAVSSESNPETKNNLVEARKALRTEHNSKVDMYNEKYRGVADSLEQRNSLVRRMNLIDELGEVLREPYNKKDFDRCLLIANSSDLAEELGWVDIER